MAGYESEFVEKPPKAVQSECPICLLVLREPYQATCCGKSFCKECIEQVKAKKQPCPTCSEIEEFSIFRNLGLQHSLYDFQVYCTHKSKGCEWTGELRELDNHLNSDPPSDKSLKGCPFTVISCPLNCTGCEGEMPRKDLKTHVNDKLVSLIISQTIQIREYQQENHSLKVQLQLVERHMAELEVKVRDINETNQQLKEEVKQWMMNQPVLPYPGQPSLVQHDAFLTGTYKPIGGELIMTDFEEYKKENEPWYSAHFYTHPQGYKMCLHVKVNDCNGTHVTVYVFMMRGEFDDQLKWPFRGVITIQLLNQDRDEGHFTATAVCHDGTSKLIARRVEGRVRSAHGQCFSPSVSHTELQPKYLKNNCLRFRIKQVVVN